MNAIIAQCFARDLEIEGSTDWQSVSDHHPGLPRGWFELIHLPADQRLEFVQQFWLHQLREEPGMVVLVEPFFARLDTIRLFLRRQEPYLVYSLKSGGFFAGQLPLGSSVIEACSLFDSTPLPHSYLAWQTIHGRFHSGEDVGILAAIDLASAWTKLQKQLRGELLQLPGHKEPIDSRKLVPFYQSFGGNYWHCFALEWFPEQMGCLTVQTGKKGLYEHS